MTPWDRCIGEGSKSRAGKTAEQARLLAPERGGAKQKKCQSPDFKRSRRQMRVGTASGPNAVEGTIPPEARSCWKPSRSGWGHCS